jgi:aminocarboxymuconate-semialdehyde decarboxylase
MAPLVDVHSHIYPPSLVGHLQRAAEPPCIREVDGQARFLLFPGDRGVAFTPDFFDVDAKLAFMSDVGIAHSVLSAGNPWLDLFPGPASVPLAQQVNAELCDIVRAAPQRLSAMAVLPNDTVEAAVRTVEHTAGQPGMVAVSVGTTICGEPLDSPELDRFWRAAESAALPVFVHPRSGLIPEATRGYGQALTLALSFPVETTVAVARLVLAGTLERHPGLRVIAAHGGGALPLLAGRLGRALAAEDPAHPAATFDLTQRAPGLYVDSILFSSRALALCIDVFGPERVLFGTDHPFPIADARQGAVDLAAAAQGAAYECIAGRNAAALFGVSLHSGGVARHG